MNVKGLCEFIRERHAIYERRQEGARRPWTADPIMQKFRFCNVYRDLDTVSQWIGDTWRDPYALDPDLWFAMTVARHLNWPYALRDMPYPLPWKPEELRARLAALAAVEPPERLFTGAFLARVPAPSERRGDFLVDTVLTPLWESRAALRPARGDLLAWFGERLLSMNLPRYVVGLIVADTKRAEGSPLHTAEDWCTWAISGPASRRGLNRLIGRPLSKSWRECDWLRNLQQAQRRVHEELGDTLPRPLDAQDLQNCIAEWDKYERVRSGIATPRESYHGA